ncbi:mitochondrial import protein Pam17-domain-containing protein [Calycina marina]|uniref:Presequence translocated-associated motor subunit PAM17 n=1 Tax=Calycina marina TaxID=1763456 RepID=A0A9P7Z029_9HELO|nr:mitochondrial import protein Pam17-domain-containing protein [Calycina marina]
MICTAPTLRSAAASLRVQPTYFTPCTYTTSSTVRSTDSPSLRRSQLPLTKRNIALQDTRSASTASPSSVDTPSAAAAPATSTVLNWNDFFRLRWQRRFWQLGSSIGTGAGGFVGGAATLSNADVDPFISQIPLDPFVTLGITCFAAGGAGWLLGPILGTAVFSWRIGRSRKQQMGEKEREFYKRVKKYRVDPSGGSVANPVPDYYGEKIASVAGYRQWLKDQRTFNKKRHTYV